MSGLAVLGAVVILALPFAAFIVWDARRDQLNSRAGVIGCLILPVGVLAAIVLVALMRGQQ